MNSILKAFGIIAIAPLALCVGIYGCTVAHVALVGAALPPAAHVQPAAVAQTISLPQAWTACGEDASLVCSEPANRGCPMTDSSGRDIFLCVARDGRIVAVATTRY
jgi:hypothetical protein